MAIDIASMVVPAGKALAPVGGSTLSDAWQAIIGDRVAAWRLKNAAKLQAAVLKAMKAQGLQPVTAKIPERYAFTWFEEATKQDEPEIQSLFATLLARASAGDKDAKDRRHIETLSRFTPTDAMVFDFVFDFGRTMQRPINPDSPPVIEMRESALYREMKDRFGTEEWMSIEQLTTLGILERQTAVDKWSLERFFRQIEPDTRRGEGLSVPLWADFELETILSVTRSGFSLRRALGKMEA